MKRRAWHILVASGALGLALGGCGAVELVGGMAQNAEYQKKIEVPPAYDGLANQKIAVLVDVNMTMLYEHPQLASQIALGVGSAIQRNVEGASVLPPQETLTWQYRTPGWNLIAPSKMTEALNVSRIVYIDVYEYRLNPPGNRYEWAGVCSADVRVFEAAAEQFESDLPAAEFSAVARFPDQALPWESASRDRIEAGVITKFVQKTAWLFYTHIEPKYPDKYRPELDQ